MTQRRGAPWPVALAVVAVVAVAALVVFVWHPWVRSAGQAADTASVRADAAGQERPVGAEDGTGEGEETGMKDERAPKTQLAADFMAGKVRSVRLVGDSITAGFGTDGYPEPGTDDTGSVIYDDGASTVFYETPSDVVCWANEFRTWAGQHGVRSFVNAGINGAFMAELAQNPEAWVAEGADVVVVALGTNDAGYYGPEEYRDAAQTAFDYVERHCSTLVVMSPVSDLRPESMLVEPAASLGDVLREICDERGYLFVDARDAVSPEQFNDDDLHPTSEGSLAIWECLRATLGL